MITTNYGFQRPLLKCDHASRTVISQAKRLKYLFIGDNVVNATKTSHGKYLKYARQICGSYQPLHSVTQYSESNTTDWLAPCYVFRAVDIQHSIQLLTPSRSVQEGLNGVMAFTANG